MRTDMCAAASLLVAGTAVPRPRDGSETPAPVDVLIQGPGGCGKSVLLRELAGGYRRAGLTVLDATTLDAETLGAGTAGSVVLVDDAHRLSDEVADGLLRYARRPGGSVVLAFRPFPRSAALSRVLDGLGGDRRSVHLRHAGEQLVHSWAREELEDAATPALVAAVLECTGGLPALVHPVLRDLATRSDRSMARRSPAPPPSDLVSAAVLDLVGAVVGDLDDGARSVLHALASGSPLDTDVLSGLLDVPGRQAADLLAAARATGLLVGDGTVIPLVASALLATTPPEVTRDTRRRLLELLLDRGEEPLQLARTLAADRVRDPRVAQLLERSGSTTLTADPALAEELLEEAAASGAPVQRLAARRAHAAALRGDFDGALQWADAVMTDESVPDRARAAAVTAAVLARRGLMPRSAELYRMAGREHAGSAALTLLATGSLEEAVAVLGHGAQREGAGPPTILTGSADLMARGVLQSLRSDAQAGPHVAAALSTLTRASTLLEPIGRAALLADTPAALAALVALHTGELGMAEAGLRRALAADVGGRRDRPRHLLLLAWTDMLRGRTSQAARQASSVCGTAGARLEPRDELMVRALEVGLARRTGDLPALLTAWGHAREALLRYPIDLFTLLPLGELMVAAARLQDSDRIAPSVAEAQALLARLGNPQLWATPLHWSGAQAAILADDPAALRPHATALVAAARTSPYAATLARAGRCWLRVLTGDVDGPAVENAAQELAALGLAWDGSRLASQAALRTEDGRVRTALLSCARALAETSGDSAVAPVPSPGAAPERGAPGLLSDRELEVAELVLTGQTYRDIGSRLFISAKTVEHHVSRMRQRLGASNRSDLLARLRAELSAHG